MFPDDAERNALNLTTNTALAYPGKVNSSRNVGDIQFAVALRITRPRLKFMLSKPKNFETRKFE